MQTFLVYLLCLFVVYRCIVHSRQTFQDGNRWGGTAILTLAPVIIAITIFYQLLR
ncbi:hypothetical protein [Gracilibacillus halophilus]|uniref:hypothetical protein n=1 Tax=Gracilibacillus halophilus TaxID=470864 RepID=UPI0003A9A1BB|nr:hypothetical protein [Gracilibacillus halophilus]